MQAFVVRLSPVVSPSSIRPLTQVSQKLLHESTLSFWEATY